MRRTPRAHRATSTARIPFVIRDAAFFRPMARLALCAMLLLALAPALSRALAAGTAGAMAGAVELCTTSGLKWVDATSLPDKAPPAHPAPMGADCAYCPLVSSLPPMPLSLIAQVPWLPLTRLATHVRHPAPHVPVRLRGLGGQGPPTIF